MLQVKSYFNKVSQKLSKKFKSLTKNQKILLGLTSGYIFYKSIRSYSRTQKSIKDKVVFITGAANGIGQELAKRFAKHGSKVVIADIDEEKAHEVANSLLSENFQALAVKCDVSDLESIQRAASITRLHFGEPSIVINNAGIAIGNLLQNFKVEDFEKTLKVNLFSHFYAIKEFLPGMLKANEGHFVNIASYAGHASLLGFGPYCASKYGAVGLNDVLRQEMKSMNANVKVTVVCPHFVETNLTKDLKSVSKIPLDYAADKIFEGILFEETEIFIPKFPKNLLKLRYILSADNFDSISFALGLNKAF